MIAVAVLLAATSAGLLLRSAGDDRMSGARGSASQAPLADPVDVVVGADGLVHVLLAGTGQLIRFEADGSASPVAGVAVEAGTACDPAARGVGIAAVEARLCRPTQVALDVDGTLLIADSGHGLVRRVAADGRIVDVTGLGPPQPFAELSGVVVHAGRLISTDAAAGAVLSGTTPPRRLASDLSEPRGVDVDARGVVHVADAAGRVVRIIDGHAETAVGVAGPGETAAVDDAANPLGSPWDVVFDAAGRMWIADAGTGTVRWRDLAGPLETVPFAFGSPVGLGAHPAGGVVVADSGRDAVWWVDTGGRVTRVA